MVLCEAVEDAAELTRIADRLAIEIGRPLATAGTALQVGASCGMAVGSTDAERLLGEADAAMYRTKRRHQAAVGATVG